MKKLRALLEISSFIVLGATTEKILIPSIKKQVISIAKPPIYRSYYKTKPPKIIIKKPTEYSYQFYHAIKLLKKQNKSYKLFMNSKITWMKNNIIWDERRMGYSSWDRDPQFYWWVIWITKEKQFNAFIQWLKRLMCISN